MEAAMSESWMNPDQVASLIRDAGAVSQIEYYVFSRESNGGKHEICCRQPAMQHISKVEAEELVKRLNAAIAPVIKETSGHMLNLAANQLRRFL